MRPRFDRGRPAWDDLVIGLGVLLTGLLVALSDTTAGKFEAKFAIGWLLMILAVRIVVGETGLSRCFSQRARSKNRRS